MKPTFRAVHVDDSHEEETASIKERLSQVEAHLITLKNTIKDKTFNAHAA